MKRETDMEQVRLTAKMLLMTDVHETEYSPMIVQHPFTSWYCYAAYHKSVIRIAIFVIKVYVFLLKDWII